MVMRRWQFRAQATHLHIEQESEEERHARRAHRAEE